jgi:hypothetical protein
MKTQKLMGSTKKKNPAPDGLNLGEESNLNLHGLNFRYIMYYVSYLLIYLVKIIFFFINNINIKLHFCFVSSKKKKTRLMSYKYLHKFFKF